MQIYNKEDDIETRKIEAHLPKINLTLSQKKAKISAAEEPRLKQIIRKPEDLIKYSRKLSELTEELTTNNINILTSKKIMYPAGTITII